MRKIIKQPISEHFVDKVKQSILHWIANYNVAIYLDSNHFSSIVPSKIGDDNYELIAGADVIKYLMANSGNAFIELKNFLTTSNDFVFGHLGYDLKNEIERLTSENFDGIGLPDMFFFQPRYVFIIKNNTLELHYLPYLTSEHEANLILQQILNLVSYNHITKNNISITQRVLYKEYYSRVEEIKCHIRRGDIYEMNYCFEFYSEDAIIDPVRTFKLLLAKNPSPFSSYYKIYDTYLMSSSPERFMKKVDKKIFSQPMKGTINRGLSEPEDINLKKQLQSDTKERAENIMVVDMVRNDFSRVAKRGSVKVIELCGVYTFPTVHQMISTVSAQLSKNTHPVDAIKSAFPMGSMTGTPKVMAMELIEKFEKTKRGLYSGAVGYFAPNGDFDFNVVIRSILYNRTSNYLSYLVGSAITDKSNIRNEYDECLLKAQALTNVLQTL